MSSNDDFKKRIIHLLQDSFDSSNDVSIRVNALEQIAAFIEYDSTSITGSLLNYLDQLRQDISQEEDSEDEYDDAEDGEVVIRVGGEGVVPPIAQPEVSLPHSNPNASVVPASESTQKHFAKSRPYDFQALMKATEPTSEMKAGESSVIRTRLQNSAVFPSQLTTSNSRSVGGLAAPVEGSVPKIEQSIAPADYVPKAAEHRQLTLTPSRDHSEKGIINVKKVDLVTPAIPSFKTNLLSSDVVFSDDPYETISTGPILKLRGRDGVVLERPMTLADYDRAFRAKMNARAI